MDAAGVGAPRERARSDGATADRGEGPGRADPGADATPFDRLAPSYDDAFSDSLIGGLLRKRVHARLAPHVPEGASVLDLGCGTGEDAVWLAGRGARVTAVDPSEAMLAEARRKAEARGVAGRIRFVRAPAEALPDGPPVDLVLSDFGALNCVSDHSAVARGLAARARRGARAFLCVMGPVVPWEWAWYLARGAPDEAFRRLRPGGTTWRGMRITYPSPGTLRRAFAPHFRRVSLTALGALVPPTYAEGWARRHEALVRELDAWERRLEEVPPLAWLADHYLLELERR